MDDIKTPCANVCIMDNDLCRGCLRSLEEIQRWRDYTIDEKREILEEIEKRKADRGVDYYGFPG
jgi:uncharacterized protein